MEEDKTADIVIEYIHYLNEDFQRIHGEDIISDIEINIGPNKQEDKMILSSEEKELYADDQVRMWFRRGDFSYKFPISEDGWNQKVKNYLNTEWEFVKYFIHDRVSEIGNYYDEVRSNKLQDLCTARDAGIDIPPTLVTTSKEKLLTFFNRHKDVISKPIHNGHLTFMENGKKYSSRGILLVDEEMIAKSSDTFCLSLFQQYVEKQFEIRIFFLKEDLYAMAIFSQLDKKTQYDYRNYNHENPNRNVPFHLPQELRTKVISFIRKSKLDTGSIDLIYTTKGTYIFLEVNPAGQFGWVSSNCNYYLEKRIAEHLTKCHD